MLDYERADHFLGHACDHRLEQLHHRLVIAKRLIGLEHGELRIVPGRDALVAVVATDLEHAIHPADEQSLEVQLQRDAQVKVAAQRVVPGDERLSRRAAGDGLHGGCLHLDEAALVHEVTNLADDRAAFVEHVLDVEVGDEVEVALTVAGLDVREAVPLGREGAQRLADDSELRRLERDLLRARGEHRPFHAEEIAEVELLQHLERLLAEGVFLCVNLHAIGAVADVQKDAFAHRAERGHAPGQGDLAAFLVIFSCAGAGLVRRKLVGKRLDALLPQRSEIGPALLD